MFGVQDYVLSDGAGVHKAQPGAGRSPATYLGVLGLTGLTAYFGLLDVGRLAADDVVLVSGAAGAVGTAVGQIATIKGAHAIGSQVALRNAACSLRTSGSRRPSTTGTETFFVEHTGRGDIETFPSTLARLFKGENTGKLVLELER